MTITLEVENSYWQYDDEQLFSVKAILETNKSCFYHYDTRWNEKVFEDMMLLPSIDNHETYFPWEMYKIYYFKTVEDPSVFTNIAFYDEKLYDFVFERASYSYNPTICKINEVCKEKRLYIYYVDKSAINPEVINQVTSLDTKMANFYCTSDYGYASYASNMLSGFSKNVYVSLDEDKLLEAVDADERLDNNSDLTVSLPNGVAGGNYINGLTGGVRFSTKPKEIVEGRMPKHNKEIAISKGLNEKLGKAYGKELYISGVISEYLKDNGEIEKDYQTTKVVVVGIINEDKAYLYHNNDWTISFFKDELGISTFNLIPKAVVFELDDNADVEKICDRFNKIFTSYSFTSPSLEISESIGSTLRYANVILIAFSVLASIISILLLSTIVMLNVIENKDELELFHYLGIKKSDAESTYIYQALLHGMIAFLMSAIEIVVVDIIISKLLGYMISSSFSYSFNPLPIIVVFLVAIFMSVLTSFTVTKLLSRKKRHSKI